MIEIDMEVFKDHQEQKLRKRAMAILKEEWQDERLGVFYNKYPYHRPDLSHLGHSLESSMRDMSKLNFPTFEEWLNERGLVK